MTDDTDGGGDDRDDREVVGGTAGDTAGGTAPDDDEGPDIGATRGENTITGGAENDPDAPADDADHGAAVVDTSVSVDADDEGKTVRDGDGEELGLVVDVSDEGDALFVDPHPRIAEHVAADLGWTERESGDFRVDAADVHAIDGDAVWVEDPE